MGLFGKKDKVVRPDEYIEENRAKLDEFEITKAWGVKKYQNAIQFIYDKDKREFVVVEGPEETFRDREPDVVSFDQVKKVYLEVEEYWTEGNGEFEPKPLNQNLLQERYKDVYWRYDFYINIETDHPYAGNIRFKTNYKPTITKVPQRGIFYRRGFEIGGTYEGEAIEILAARLNVFNEDEKDMDKIERKIEIFTLHNKGKGTLEGIRDELVNDAKKEIYYKKISNMGAHVKRAERISKLLISE